MKYIFLAAAFMLATIASANADTTCAVNSPDGELNVRELTQNGPGKVIGVVKNGYTVTMRDFYFLRGQSWARVVDGKTRTRVVGWMFKDYLNCNTQAAAPSQVTSPAPTRKGSAVYLKKSGVWVTYTDVSDKGEKILGMYTIVGDQAGFFVKYFGGSTQLVVQMFKKGWQFPSGGVDVSFSIKFDDGEPYPGTGNALMDDAGKSNDPLALVEAPIRDPELAAKFMNELMHADKMTITFDQGNERPWIVDMNGTRETGTAFNKAMEAMCNCTKSTQPYNTTKPTAKKNDRAI